MINRTLNRRAGDSGLLAGWHSLTNGKGVVFSSTPHPSLRSECATRLSTLGPGFLPSQDGFGHRADAIGLFGGEIFLFVAILRQVIKLSPAAVRIDQQLPVPVAHGERGAAVLGIFRIGKGLVIAAVFPV